MRTSSLASFLSHLAYPSFIYVHFQCYTLCQSCIIIIILYYTVVVCVCVSVTLHLTSRMSVRLKNDTIYLTGTEGQKIRAASFERYGVICVSRQRTRPYLVFVTTQASLLVKKANEILSTTRNTSQ